VKMTSPGEILRGMRRSAALSQRALAERAATSQPAIVRYERESATPSWETLERLAEACGRQLRLSAEIVPDPHDVALAERFLDLTTEQRLRALRRFARLRDLAEEQL
jgi:transcriptional regulator with XRE-family HTH domain